MFSCCAIDQNVNYLLGQYSWIYGGKRNRAGFTLTDYYFTNIYTVYLPAFSCAIGLTGQRVLTA
jgi:hypothetical protein